MKIEAPIEYRELDHTADIAIEVEGAVEEEIYARAALALGQMLAGGGALTQQVERTLEPAGHDRLSQLVGLLRDVLAAFYDERLILCAVDVRLGPPFSAIGWFAHWDPALHRRASMSKPSPMAARASSRGRNLPAGARDLSST